MANELLERLRHHTSKGEAILEVPTDAKLQWLNNQWLEADMAWHNAIQFHYRDGKAGEHRYTDKGRATPELKRAADHFAACRDEFLSAWDRRKEYDKAQVS